MNVLAKAGHLTDERAAARDKIILKNVIEKEVIREALAQLIVVRNLPFNAVKWPELRALLLSVNPEAGDALDSSHTTVPELIQRSFIADREILQQRLYESVSLIHLAVDVWSSPNRKSFLAIVAHFVDHTFTVRKALLALPYLGGKHGGDEQADPLWETLTQYKIEAKIGYCTGDNHGSNDKLLRNLARRLIAEGLTGYRRSQFNPTQRRIRCHGHVINIAVQAFFFCEDKAAVDTAFEQARVQLEMDDEVDDDDIDRILQKRFRKSKTSKYTFRSMGVAGKVHNLVTFIRSSNERYIAFVQRAGQMIPLDNDTRWNSWFKMLEVALHLRPAIKDYQEANYRDIDDADTISPADWDSLIDVVEFLQPFKRVTKEVEGDTSTLDLVLFTMDFLVNHYRKYAVRTPLRPYVFC
jgi:hypothetical protein